MTKLEFQKMIRDTLERVCVTLPSLGEHAIHAMRLFLDSATEQYKKYEERINIQNSIKRGGGYTSSLLKIIL